MVRRSAVTMDAAQISEESAEASTAEGSISEDSRA